MGIGIVSLAVWFRFGFVVGVVCGAAVFIKFNEHRRAMDGPDNRSKPTTAAEHFLSSPNHTADDMILVPIGKIFSNRGSIRGAGKFFWFRGAERLIPMV